MSMYMQNTYVRKSKSAKIFQVFLFFPQSNHTFYEFLVYTQNVTDTLY